MTAPIKVANGRFAQFVSGTDAVPDGMLSANIPLLNGANTFPALQTIASARIAVHYGAWTTAVDAATVTLDLSITDKYTLIATSGVGAGRTIAFSNFSVGQVLLFEFVQASSAGPYTLIWPTIRWAAGSTPAPATAANKGDLFTIVKRSDGTYAGALSIPNY